MVGSLDRLALDLAQIFAVVLRSHGHSIRIHRRPCDLARRGDQQGFSRACGHGELTVPRQHVARGATPAAGRSRGSSARAVLISNYHVALIFAVGRGRFELLRCVSAYGSSRKR